MFRPPFATAARQWITIQACLPSLRILFTSSRTLNTCARRIIEIDWVQRFVLKSSRRANLCEAIYAECNRLESCSKDPIGYVADECNLFGFVSGRPFVFSDPYGLCSAVMFFGHRDHIKWVFGIPIYISTSRAKKKLGSPCTSPANATTLASFVAMLGRLSTSAFKNLVKSNEYPGGLTT
jgi:hypothetical protein